MAITDDDIPVLVPAKKPRTKAQMLASRSNWQKGRLHRIEGAIKYELEELAREGIQTHSYIAHALRIALSYIQGARKAYTTLVTIKLAALKREKEKANEDTNSSASGTT